MLEQLCIFRPYQIPPHLLVCLSPSKPILTPRKEYKCELKSQSIVILCKYVNKMIKKRKPCYSSIKWQNVGIETWQSRELQQSNPSIYWHLQSLSPSFVKILKYISLEFRANLAYDSFIFIALVHSFFFCRFHFVLGATNTVNTFRV